MAIVFTTDLGDKGTSQSQFVYEFVQSFTPRMIKFGSWELSEREIDLRGRGGCNLETFTIEPNTKRTNLSFAESYVMLEDNETPKV